MFEREQLRCKLLEGRVEEMKLKGRATTGEVEDNTVIENPPLNTATLLDPDNPDEFMSIISSDLEFRDVYNNFQDLVIKVEKKRQERQYVMETTEFEMQPQVPQMQFGDQEPKHDKNEADITNTK